MPARHKSIKKVRQDRLKKFIDQRLIRALGHPVRAHILAVLNERVASTREIGDEIELDVSAFYKHVEVLEELGCIERVESRRRRGFNEHFFRARSTLSFDDRDWRQLPASLKADLSVGPLQLILDDVVAALKAGTFMTRSDRHVSWNPGFFDAQGWSEVVALMKKTLLRLIAIHHRSAARIAKTGEPGIPATVALLGFETCPAAAPPGAKRWPADGRG
jgi:DNA-binding transcriptional ArsR family regulator